VCSEARMVRNMAIIDVFAPSYCVNKRSLNSQRSIELLNSQKGYHRYSQSDAASTLQRLVFVTDRNYSFVEAIDIAIIGLFRNHFKHPRTVFKHQRKIDVFVFLSYFLPAQFELSFGI